MKTLGIVGGGQLGRMMAEAAQKIGVETVVLDPTPGCPASAFARQVVGDFKDYETVKAFAKEADVLTFEIESANAEALSELSESGYPVHPSPHTLSIIRDKLAQKKFLTENGIAVAPFLEVNSKEDAEQAGQVLGYPFVLKARSGGYDGKGNSTVHSSEDIATAFEKLGGGHLYAEKFVPFEKELAVVAVRSEEGEIRTYPTVETVHENHICVLVRMPALVPEPARQKAEAIAEKVLGALHGVGVISIEMFLSGGEILVNEIAPRVHNSGHITQDACATSQFENHVRAVMGMSLGDVAMTVRAGVMANILGTRNGESVGVQVEGISGVALHLYEKKDVRVGRKMGHINAVADTQEEAEKNALLLLSRVII
ncbi:5-(carboxyamino)imidazole ribonucleotide synthase [Patescibacteria group bacterium]|nr:5-(carboxyamino)imidazole ribonucleotide synthase [Patescibacteria group bacterium]